MRWISTLAAIFVANASFASPIVYEYEAGPGTFGGVGGTYSTFDLITASYETGNGSDIFSWSVDYGDSAADGFWLVVSDGPNPKGLDGQLAILYGDTNNGNLVAYEYNGQNNSTSWIGATALADFTGSLVSTATGYSFTIDVTALNNLGVLGLGNPWEGIQFGAEFGIWYHPTWWTSSTNTGGELTAFNYEYQGWFDRKDQPTTRVPEPGTLALFGIGLMGMGIARRRKIA